MIASNRTCKRIIVGVAGCVMCLFSAMAVAMEAMDDAGLAEISGQDGVALDLEFRANMEEDGVGGFRPIQAAPFNSCSGNNNPCKLGINFAARDTAWIVIKDYYARIVVDTIQLDVATINTGGGSAFAGDMSQFENPAGTCLLDNDPAGCSAGDLDGDPALQISFPTLDSGGNPRTRTDYTDILILQNMGRVSAEYDGGGLEGFERDAATGSVLGFRMQDNNGGPAQTRWEGRSIIFGF